MALAPIFGSGSDLAEARREGIVSATTLAGWSKADDNDRYLIAMTAGVATALLLWMVWCVLAGRGRRGAPDVVDAPATLAQWEWSELAIVAGVLLLGLLRFDLAANGWDAPFTFYFEEGKSLVWADVILRGGVLPRDAYCLYGPLANYPFAALFAWLGPSVHLWRLGLYLLDVPALLAVYLLVREFGRSRLEAWAGVALIGFHRMWPMPALSWSLLRTGLGLGAIAALAAFLRTGRRAVLLAGGALAGAATMFSQEAGFATAIALAAAIVFDAIFRRGGARAVVRHGALAAAGAAAVILPILAWCASQGALATMVDNLVEFPRLRVLGHGALPFPSLAGDAAAWARSPSSDTWEALALSIAAYFGPVLYAFASFRVGTQALEGRLDIRAAVRVALVVYGAALFEAALSRPDATHVLFALPPALILAVDSGREAIAIARDRRARPARRTAAGAFLAIGVVALAVFPTDTMENLNVFARQVVLNLSGRLAGNVPAGMRALDLARGGGVCVPADRADEIEQVVRYVTERTAPAEPVWAFPEEPMLVFLADRPLAGRYPASYFAVTSAQRVELIAGVEKSGVRYAIVNRKPPIIDDITSRQFVPEVWAYLESHFVVEATFGRFDVMRRVEAPLREAPPGPAR